MTDGSQTYRFDYDDQGNVRTYTAGNGSGSTFNYDHANKIKDLVVGTSNSTLLSERYEYDQAGNRTKIKHEGAGGKVTETNFVYDPINQLLNEALPNGTTKSYTYDGFGNRTSDGKYKYTWNEHDQIVAITKQGESDVFATYKYDENNRRIEKSVNGQVTRYFYDGDSINPLYETDGSGNVLRQYVYSTSGTRLAMKSKGQTLYYHYNPRGDVVAMTDQNREVVATYEYDSWGNVLKSDTKGIATDNPFGYAGYMYDKEIGMYYLIARYYNPDHGVFLSVDADPGDSDDPVTQNGYTYGDNNPVMMVDPDGHKAWKKKAKRIWYATKAGAKAGGKAWVDSYLSIGKGLALGAGYFYGYATGKQNYINKNKPVYNKAYVNKAARKAGLKVGLKAFWGFGLIEDAYVFGSAAYKGYKKAYKNHR